tara:strand:+ start:381 stop:803 length:423 start_codon:yes stop_codon:yes gene_type:complete
MRVEKIETFNKQNLEQLRKAINNSLGLIGRTFGIEITLGSVSYQKHNFTGKLIANLESKDGELFTKQAIDYKAFHEDYGLEKEWLGQSFDSRGKTYTVVGLNTKASKYPVICECAGKEYCVPVQSVRLGFKGVSNGAASL